MRSVSMVLLAVATAFLVKGCGSDNLLEAVRTGDATAVEELLEKGVSAESRGAKGCTPLHLACEQGDVEIARLLLGHGADIEARDDRGRVPLHMAAENGHFDVVQWPAPQKRVQVLC
jgi:ankyrin repeat protein